MRTTLRRTRLKLVAADEIVAALAANANSKDRVVVARQTGVARLPLHSGTSGIRSGDLHARNFYAHLRRTGQSRRRPDADRNATARAGSGKASTTACAARPSVRRAALLKPPCPSPAAARWKGTTASAPSTCPGWSRCGEWPQEGILRMRVPGLRRWISLNFDTWCRIRRSRPAWRVPAS